MYGACDWVFNKQLCEVWMLFNRVDKLLESTAIEAPSFPVWEGLATTREPELADYTTDRFQTISSRNKFLPKEEQAHRAPGTE